MMSIDFYVYGWYKDGEAYYIGKGSTDRVYQHHEGIERPPIEDRRILIDCLSEGEAYDEEKKFIKAIGRKDLGEGPLLNKSDGGWGTMNVSESTRRRQSEIGKIRGNDPAERKRRSERSTKAMADPKMRQHLSEIGKIIGNDPAERKRRSERGLKRYEDPQAHIDTSIAVTAALANSVVRDKITAANIERYKDPANREHTRQKNIERYKDPAERLKTSEATRLGIARAKQRRQLAKNIENLNKEVDISHNLPYNNIIG